MACAVLLTFVDRIQYSLCTPLRSAENLVVPESEYLPPEFAKSPIHRFVARNIALDFRDPELAIRLNGLSRPRPIPPVPERGIAKHRDLAAYYNEIWPTWHFDVLLPVPEARRPHRAPQSRLDHRAGATHS